MIKIWIGIGLLCMSLAICACKESTPSLNLQEAVDQYSHISTFKGLEVYVWYDQAMDQLLVGMLPGTNRNKTEADYQLLYELPIDLQTAKAILSHYDADTYVFVMNLGQPLTEKQQEKVMAELGGHPLYDWKDSANSKSMSIVK